MPSSRAFEDSFRQEILTMDQDLTLSDHALYREAERYLQVLASFEDLNQPAWVRRIQRYSWRYITYTSQKLFEALYQIADTLKLSAGKRYVSATICACGSRVESAGALLEDQPREVAEALSQLASAWIAFMLWPFFIDGQKSAEEVLVRPRCLPLLFGSAGSQNDNDRRWAIKEGLLKRSGYTCFMSGSVYFRAPPKLFRGVEHMSVADLRVTHILRPPCAMRELGMRDEDEVVTSDILEHYCGPICADVVHLGKDGVTEARNALVMGADSCSTFNSFRWCLHPTQVAHQYHVQVYERNWFGAQYVASSIPVTFEDHSHEFPDLPSNGTGPPSASDAVALSENLSSPHARSLQRDSNVNLPSAELLRVHAALAGVLQLSGAMTAFEALLSACESLDGACVPNASGGGFLQSVVAYEGREVCSDAESLIRAQADDSDSDYVP